MERITDMRLKIPADAQLAPMHTKQTRSAGKEIRRPSHSTANRAVLNSSTSREPRILLKKVEVFEAKVDNPSGVAYRITLGLRGESFQKEKVEESRQEPNEMELCSTPTTGSERGGGESRDVSLSQSQLPPSDSPKWVTGIEVDSLDGSGEEEDDDVIDVTSDVAMKEKRGRSCPATVGLHVGKRLEDEERARKKKERERARNAKMVLDPLIPPKGPKWKEVLKKEEEIEDELADAPMEDVVARMVEQSATIFKVADCSNNMKGNLVAEMRKAVAMIRATASVMATRVKNNEKGGGNNEEVLSCHREVEQLKAQV